MKLTHLALIAAAAELTLAATLTEQRRARHAERIAKRESGVRKSQPRITDSEVAFNESSHVSYSTNWAGAVQTSTKFNYVTGTIVVPTPAEGASGGAKASLEGYSASAWVGIDGDTCSTAILQTGIDFSYKSGSVSFDAWYEWYPDYAYDFTLDISAGDTITMTVEATSTSKGTATIENVTTGKTVDHTFTSSEGDLCEYDAEWIVEDFEEGVSLVPFADFDSVTFTDAYATKSTGATVDAGTDATIIDIRQSGTVYTSCSASGTTVTCDYTG